MNFCECFQVTFPASTFIISFFSVKNMFWYSSRDIHVAPSQCRGSISGNRKSQFLSFDLSILYRCHVPFLNGFLSHHFPNNPISSPVPPFHLYISFSSLPSRNFQIQNPSSPILYYERHQSCFQRLCQAYRRRQCP